VRNIINGVCYQRYEKHLEQQKGRPKVNFCAAEESLEEEISSNQYTIIISIQTSPLIFDYRFYSSKPIHIFLFVES